MKDPVCIDEARYDREMELAQEREDVARDAVDELYADGGYEDEIVECVVDAPHDATRLALALVEQMDANPQADWSWLSHLSLELRDFRSMIESVKEQAVQRELAYH